LVRGHRLLGAAQRSCAGRVGLLPLAGRTTGVDGGDGVGKRLWVAQRFQRFDSGC
jgi:hypothetical protein